MENQVFYELYLRQEVVRNIGISHRSRGSWHVWLYNIPGKLTYR